jgi:hypothetical protein
MFADACAAISSLSRLRGRDGEGATKRADGIWGDAQASIASLPQPNSGVPEFGH